jgi:hypothetical protein
MLTPVFLLHLRKASEPGRADITERPGLFNTECEVWAGCVPQVKWLVNPASVYQRPWWSFSRLIPDTVPSNFPVIVSI